MCICNCFQVVKFLVLYASLIPMAPYAKLDISLQVGNTRLRVSLDQWKYMATEAQTLVVTCEEGWVFLYTAIKSLFGDHSGHRQEALWRTFEVASRKNKEMGG
jgi:hypothetical protein